MVAMNLKEFDAKQFMLEKGERVGLGVALTLMVLMLIFSLFMPSSGFFSGSPSAKAQPLEEGSKQLTNKLNTLQPTERDLPDKDPQSRLIALDTERLKPEFYETSKGFFEPNRSESPTRRPPEILAVVESAAQFVRLPIDTYIFNRDFSKITVLQDKGDKKAGGGGGANNPMMRMQQMMRGRSGMPGVGGVPGGGGSGGAGRGMMPGMQNMFNRFGGSVMGSEEKPEYDAKQVPLTDLENSQPHLARQVRPARMVIVEASFPYKEQLNQFKDKLRLPDINAVLNETVEYENKEQLAAFRFAGVDVQRQELDEYGNVVKDWESLDLTTPYKTWLQHSGLPFEEELAKYDPIRPLFPGLVMPRLREFREDYQEAMSMAGPMMPAGVGGAVPPGGAAGKQPESKDSGTKSKYPDVARNLKSIQDTLDKLTAAGPKPVAVPPEKFRGAQSFDPFNTAGPTTGGENKDGNKPPDTAAGTDTTTPEHTLLRFVDITVEPGKTYKYRFKVKMANPNFRRDDVASPAYKMKPEIEAKDWFTVKDAVRVPPDLSYYVVDQKEINKGEKHAVGTPLYNLWNRRVQEGQVAIQLQRWVAETPIDKDSGPVPIGDWAVADRVLVARGEYVGQTVKVDLPVWKYTQDSYVLPAEDQRARKVRGKVPTGVSVNFAQENPDGSETILLDFEGGQEFLGKLADNSAIEVLLLSPEGKLLARNSGADNSDKKREDRREEYVKRIQEVREGHKASNTSGLDAPRGGRGAP
jgi:hypothetical protein